MGLRHFTTTTPLKRGRGNHREERGKVTTSRQGVLRAWACVGEIGWGKCLRRRKVGGRVEAAERECV